MFSGFPVLRRDITNQTLPGGVWALTILKKDWWSSTPFCLANRKRGDTLFRLIAVSWGVVNLKRRNYYTVINTCDSRETKIPYFSVNSVKIDVTIFLFSFVFIGFNLQFLGNVSIHCPLMLIA
jgi:hypothetical protein